MNDPYGLLWVETLADKIQSDADQALIDAMMANGEDPTNTELWLTRRAQLGYSLNSRASRR